MSNYSIYLLLLDARSKELNLKKYLKINMLTQQQFALTIGKKQTTVSRYILGNRIPTTSVILKIHEVTGGLVSYNDWYPNKKEQGEDAQRLKSLLKGKRIKLQNLASYLGYSGSRLSQKFTENSFTNKEIADIIYYINHVNPITGEIIEQPVSENRGYIRATRNLKIFTEHNLKPFDLTLLYVITQRANKVGQALIGDYAKFGLSQKEYIAAKKKLEKLGWCEFTGIPQKGTIAKLLPNPLFQP